MKGREGKGPPSADLLVCFPSRAHLTLMAPKPICSPSRPSEPSTRHHRRRSHHHHHHHNLRNTSNRGSHASPQVWAKNKHVDISEPTSPKVTCAGQIKVRPKKGSCKSWQSVMEEIERLHNKNKKKKHSWGEALGLKKDVMGFLTCLRNVRFDFRCFGGFPNVEVTSDDEEDEDEDEDNEDEEENDQSESSKAFSKWFMILQESNEIKTGEVKTKKVDDDVDGDHVAPPKNALLLMRCRSAPAKSWLEEKDEEEAKSECDEKENEEMMKKKLEAEETERLVVMRCGTDFSKFSCDIAKETWVVGGIKDMLSRSLSSKR